MFSAMISRSLLLLLAFILAFGAGWAIYELRLEETADLPPGPAPGRTAGEAGGAERSSEQGPGAPQTPVPPIRAAASRALRWPLRQTALSNATPEA